MSAKSILYQDGSERVTIIDIPRSITQAQGVDDEYRTLLSCPALDEPWPSTEPKSTKGRQRLDPLSDDDKVIINILQHGLDCIVKKYKGSFCHPRALVREHDGQRKRRRTPSPPLADQLDRLVSGQAAISNNAARVATERLAEDRLSLEERWEVKSDEVGEHLIHNPSPHLKELHVHDEPKPCLIPPGSSFFLADCSQSSAFHSSLHEQAQAFGGSRRFDIVLLDPPWPNKSIKHGKQKGNTQYKVSTSMYDLRQLLFEMDVGPLIVDGGFVAVWITNKAAARDLVLSEEDGLFATWDVELIEEWIWLKVTAKGEPVLPLDGLWRKPYEILLIGRKASKAHVPSRTRSPKSEVKQRVIMAVPDLHSRKPCLKSLLSKAFGLTDDYRGLEIFARNLVSGWCSWGNEVLKFNHVACWADRDAGQRRPG